MSYSTGSEFANEYANDGLYTTPVGHQGVAFVAASGDDGAAHSPQASPNVIDVGGTALPADPNGNPVRSQEVGWSLGSDANLPVNPDPYLASGGGISLYEAQPPYQQGVVTQSTIYRTEPDVAYDADPATGIPIYDSLSSPPGMPWGQVGGTSIGVLQWAAVIAIADQARAAKGENTLDGPTQLLPALYQISQTDPHAFDDITQGQNGYSAGPGYDLVTGLGTPNCADSSSPISSKSTKAPRPRRPSTGPATQATATGTTPPTGPLWIPPAQRSRIRPAWPQR